jgi:hypothetical protein
MTTQQVVWMVAGGIAYVAFTLLVCAVLAANRITIDNNRSE